MTELLQSALARVHSLAESEQDIIAIMILQHLDDETSLDAHVPSIFNEPLDNEVDLDGDAR